MAAETNTADYVRHELAARMNQETVREQQQALRRLESDVRRLRICLGSIYKNAKNLPGRAAVQALIDAGTIKAEELL